MKQVWPAERPAPRFTWQTLGGGAPKAMPMP
jgi:hypothetical protein